MAQFGVFLIPAAGHPFYRLGTSMLGYDIWARSHGPSALVGITDAASLKRWLGFAPSYGLHCTIAGGALTYDPADRAEILARLGWIAGRTAPFTLVNGRIDGSFHATPRVLVAGFDSPDEAISRLHRQVVTMISPLRTGRVPSRDALQEGRLQAIYQLTGEAWALEHFAPHWSLLVDLPDQAAWDTAHAALTERLGLFRDERSRTLAVSDIHLVEKGDDGFFTVAASFPLTGPA